MIKKSFMLLVFLLAVFSLSSCTLKEKEFTGAGITITLNASFVEKETVLVPFYLESKDHIFMGMRESKTTLSQYGIRTLETYMNAVLANGGKGNAVVSTYDSDGIKFLYAYYHNTVEEIEYGYMLIAMEGTNHFYSMNFGCLTDDLEGNKDLYIDWAKGIVVI